MFVPCSNDKHFIIQQMHKYIIRRYIVKIKKYLSYIYELYICAFVG